MKQKNHMKENGSTRCLLSEITMSPHGLAIGRPAYIRKIGGLNPSGGTMRTKIVEAETVVVVEYPYRLNERVGIQDIIFKRYYQDFRNNQEMTLLYKLVEFKQKEDW